MATASGPSLDKKVEMTNWEQVSVTGSTTTGSRGYGDGNDSQVRIADKLPRRATTLTTSEEILQFCFAPPILRLDRLVRSCIRDVHD